MDIIQYLLFIIQYLYQQSCWLISFICKYIPLKQWAFDDSHSPKYQKFKIDQLPIIQPFIKQDYLFFLEYHVHDGVRFCEQCFSYTKFETLSLKLFPNSSK